MIKKNTAEVQTGNESDRNGRTRADCGMVAHFDHSCFIASKRWGFDKWPSQVEREEEARAELSRESGEESARKC